MTFKTSYINVPTTTPCSAFAASNSSAIRLFIGIWVWSEKYGVTRPQSVNQQDAISRLFLDPFQRSLIIDYWNDQQTRRIKDYVLHH